MSNIHQIRSSLSKEKYLNSDHKLKSRLASKNIEIVRSKWMEACEIEKINLLKIYFKAMQSLVNLSREKGCGKCAHKYLLCGMRSYLLIKNAKNSPVRLSLRCAQYAKIFYAELIESLEKENNHKDIASLKQEYSKSYCNLVLIN